MFSLSSSSSKEIDRDDVSKQLLYACEYTLWEKKKFSPRQSKEEKMLRFFLWNPKLFFLRRDKMQKKREKERKKERHVSQEIRIFGGRVCFKAAEDTDVLGIRE